MGLEANGTVYGYALDQTTGGFTRVATIASGFPSVMDLEFEPSTGHLWAECDDTCSGRTALLDIDTGATATHGKFLATTVYQRPASAANLNNEGFAIAPQSECVAGHKPVYWSDDSNDDGHALRAGTVDCAPVDLDADGDGIQDAVDALPEDPANGTFSDAPLGGTTSGRILDRGGRDVVVGGATDPTRVFATVSPGSAPARFQLDGLTATVALGQGSYELTGAGGTGTVSALIGDPAVITVAVNGLPVTLTVAAGGSVTFTEQTGAGGKVTGLSGIRRAGEVTVHADGTPGAACGTIAVQNVIVGTTGNDVITGTGGNDLIVDRGGNDTVIGGGGSDCVVTGSGNDRVTTGDDDDWVDAGNGNNTVNAGGGANAVTTGSGNDTIATGGGDDTMDAGGGNNAVATGAGDDGITTGSGNDTVDCGAGSDTAHVGGGNNANAGGRCEAIGA